MMFPIQEIGSLPKTLWRLKAFTKEGLDDEALEQARAEGSRLGVRDHGALLHLLSKRRGFGADEKALIKTWASRYTLRYLEAAGLDIVYDGEETRTEMYDWPVQHCHGFANRGWLRSWDHLYFKKAAVVDVPRTQGSYHLDEFQHAQEHATKTLKVPITGAYTLMDWSFDEHYYPKATGSTTARRRKARQQLVTDLARNVLHPNNKALIEAGAPIVQIDEPAATTKPDEVDLFVSSFNDSVEGLAGRFSVHICFSDYRLLFPHVLELENCSQLALELANKDSWRLGTGRADRPGYETLYLWDEYGADFEVGLGVLDVHTDEVESPELVRDRIVHAANVLGPGKIYVNPDCGLRTRRWPVVEAKLKSLVEGTRMAREEFA
jgi:5-methyltetrahydropteroyltriglutamate--homocysteine methyltransferase